MKSNAKQLFTIKRLWELQASMLVGKDVEVQIINRTSKKEEKQFYEIECDGFLMVKAIACKHADRIFVQKPEMSVIRCTRKREVVEGRQAVMTYLKDKFKARFSLKYYGKDWGGHNYDHTTVMHANRTVSDLLESNKMFQIKYAAFLEDVEKDLEKYSNVIGPQNAQKNERIN